MKTVTKEICEIIEDRDMKLTEVAKLIGASKQAMSKFKNDGSIGFRYLLKLSYLLYPNEQENRMEEWCLRLDSAEAIKQSFEYAAITRNIPLLQKLINKHSKEKGVIGEYVTIYDIIYRGTVNEISYIEMGKSFSKLHPKDNALSILLLLYKCYFGYYDNNFLLVLELAQELESRIKELSDKRELFIKECYLHRLSEILGPICLHLNNLTSARHYASIIINANICAKTKSDAYYIMGMSYLLNDEKKCLSYMSKSYDIMSTVNDAALEKESKINLDFVRVYFGKELDDSTHPSIKALRQLKNGEKTFKEIEEVLYQGEEDDFIVFYKCLSENSVDSLYDCHERFFNQHNFFFASAIATELIKAGENSRAVRNLLNYKITQKGDVYFEEDFIDCFSGCSDRAWSSCG